MTLTPRRLTALLACLMLMSLAGCQSSPCGSCSQKKHRLFSGGLLSGGLFPGRSVSTMPPAYISQPSPTLDLPAGTISAPPTISTPVETMPSPTSAAPLPDDPNAPEPVLTPAPTSGEKTRTPTSSLRPNEIRRSNYGDGSTLTSQGRPRGENLARALLPRTPKTSIVSTSPTTTATPAPRAGSSLSALDQLPPLESAAPADLASEANASASPPAIPSGPPTSDAPPKPSAPTTTTQAPNPPATQAAGGGAAESTSGTRPPGLSAFASVEPGLALGTTPTPETLRWLADHGYKTILDLRDGPEPRDMLIASAARAGLRYVALPISLDSWDGQTLNRFDLEIRLEDARPLYVFDGDGSRAGAVWLVRRVTRDQAAIDQAEQELAEAGLKRAEARHAARALIRKLAPEVLPVSRTETSVPLPTLPTLVAEALPIPRNPRVKPDEVQPKSDPAAWRPYAAMGLSVLSLPLVYFTQAGVVRGVQYVRASLPAPGRRLRSLPGGSDGGTAD